MIGAYFDCSFGASGDMLLGSLLAAGASYDYVLEELSKLEHNKLFGKQYELLLEDTKRSSILAKKATVSVKHSGSNGDTTHLSEHGKKYIEIKNLIESSRLKEADKELAIKIFERLAQSEARVHGMDLDKVHFHEVGCLDAVIDVVGFSIAFNSLAIEKVFVSSLPLGSGTVKTEHGVFPVPSPAVAYLIQEAGCPTSAMQLPFECLTPTGAAILCTIASHWDRIPPFESVSSVGYGAGSLDPKGHPNVARCLVGVICPDKVKPIEESSSKFSESSNHIVALIEANIDDLSPDILSFAQDKLLSEGALDVSVAAVTMKKGRSGHKVSVMVNPGDKERFERLLFEETSTIGLRSSFVERQVLKRNFVEVSLGESKISIKIAYDRSGKVLNVSPEYVDCAKYASANKIPLKEVYDLALASYRKNSS